MFDVNQEGGEGWVEFRVTAQADGPLYCYFPTDRFKPARMYVNGEDFGRMFDTYTQGITYLGMYEAGDTVAVRLVPEYGMLRLYEPLFYTEDLALLQSACNAMQPGFAGWKRCRPRISKGMSPRRRTARWSSASHGRKAGR